MLDAYFEAHDLPRHPLEAEGYPPIGCSPCTSKVKPGDDTRPGRWRGWDKTECGINTEVTPLDDDTAKERKSTRLNSSNKCATRMTSSARKKNKNEHSSTQRP